MERAADPYVDTSVIDARAPRFNQAVVGLLSLVAVTTGPWWLLALLALQLAIGLTLGRRWCLPCLAYFELVQPRFGEGQLEDARPPRFANLVGLIVLTAASSVDESGRPAAERWHDSFLWSRALTISGGSSEIMRGLIGRQLLGLPRA